jgi:hypothetical protein
MKTPLTEPLTKSVSQTKVLDLTRHPGAQAAHPQGFIPVEHARADVKSGHKLSSGAWVLSTWLEPFRAAFRPLDFIMDELVAAKWHIGLSDAGEHAEILASERVLLIPGFGHDWERLSRHGLFGTLAQLECLKGLRLAWQAERGLTPDILGLAPPDWLQLARAREADADLFMLLACYSCKDERDGQLWRYALAGDLYSVAEQLSRMLAVGTGSVAVEKALVASFIHWHQQAHLVTPIDRTALDMIDAMANESALPTGRCSEEMLAALGTMTKSFSYLAASAGAILRRPDCKNIPDLVAQTHLLQIMEEQQYMAIGPVVLRDTDLARKLFPDRPA